MYVLSFMKAFSIKYLFGEAETFEDSTLIPNKSKSWSLKINFINFRGPVILKQIIGKVHSFSKQCFYDLHSTNTRFFHQTFLSKLQLISVERPYFHKMNTVLNMNGFQTTPFLEVQYILTALESRWVEKKQTEQEDIPKKANFITNTLTAFIIHIVIHTISFDARLVSLSVFLVECILYMFSYFILSVHFLHHFYFQFGFQTKIQKFHFSEKYAY